MKILWRKYYLRTIVLFVALLLLIVHVQRTKNRENIKGEGSQNNHKYTSDYGSNKSIEIIFGGDVSFDLKINRPRIAIMDYPRGIIEKIKDKIYYGKNMIVGGRFPQIVLSEWIDEFSWWEKENFIDFDLAFSNETEEAEYPFKKISGVLENADIAFVNLESPIANKDDCRVIGYYVSKPIFANSLKNAGVDLVSIANNHAWDASEEGFLQTIANIENAGIKAVGGGRDINEARKPAIFEINSVKVGFLAYSQQLKYGFVSVADYKNAGIAPFNLIAIAEDIGYAKKVCDLVFVSLHWDLENTTEIHPKAKEAAYYIIDAGADGIIGHHSHIPKGIEIYKGKPIIYSLGNFIFGHNTKWWDSNNILIKIIVDNKEINRVEILPISGKGKKLYQPEIIFGREAEEVLQRIAKLSSDLKTKVEVINYRGSIDIK